MKIYARNSRYYGVFQFVLDIAILVVGYIIAFYMRSEELWDVFVASWKTFIAYTSIIAGVSCLLYRPYRCGIITYSETIFNSVISSFVTALGLILFDYIVDGNAFWRSAVFYALCVQIGAFIIVKTIVYLLFFLIYRKINAVIIGEREEALRLAVKIVGTQKHLYQIKAIVEDQQQLIEKWLPKVDEVYCCASIDENRKQQIIKQALVAEKTVHVVTTSNTIFDTSGLFSQISDIPSITYSNKMTQESRLTKRMMDIVLSILLAIIASPLMMVAIFGIKIQDGGPIFFKQERVTINNKRFMLVKFRSMINNAEEETGAVLSSKGDKRITSWGRVLRLLRIDELPQLWNVVKGEMSLIGPRPERPELIDKISKNIPEFNRRTKMKAGITGLAQVMGRYSTSHYDKLMFDLYYIENYSVFLDLRILFLTIQTVLTKSSSEGISESKEDAEKILENLGYELKKETSSELILNG